MKNTIANYKDMTVPKDTRCHRKQQHTSSTGAWMSWIFIIVVTVRLVPQIWKLLGRPWLLLGPGRQGNDEKQGG
uniref:Uncharacterized protein n=1 Tax=viral metagenome TaxID=1070528 RepID=A0A6M3J599_9ZZZZ